MALSSSSDCARRGHQSRGLELLGERQRRVLAAAIGVTDQPNRGTAALERHGERGQHQLGLCAHVRGRGPAHDHAAEGIQHDDQIVVVPGMLRVFEQFATGKTFDLALHAHFRTEQGHTLRSSCLLHRPGREAAESLAVRTACARLDNWMVGRCLSRPRHF